jgi:hypothetical protein
VTRCVHPRLCSVLKTFRPRMIAQDHNSGGGFFGKA